MRIPVAKAQNKDRDYSVSLTEGAVPASAQWAWDSVKEAIGGELHTLAFKLHAKRAGRGLRISGQLSASGTQPCSSCGEPTEVRVCSTPDLVFHPEETESSASDELELERADLNVGWYSGDALELGDVLQEIVALELPLRIICADRGPCESRSAALFGPPEPTKRANPFASLKKMCL